MDGVYPFQLYQVFVSHTVYAPLQAYTAAVSWHCVLLLHFSSFAVHCKKMFDIFVEKLTKRGSFLLILLVFVHRTL